jgi:hypothetical protein
MESKKEETIEKERTKREERAKIVDNGPEVRK